MKCTSVLSFVSSAMAVAIPQVGTTETLRFGGIALATGTDIHFSSISASGLKLNLGKNTTTYCPADAGVDCGTVNTNQTIFSYLNGAGSLNLSTQVPGGQQVYVTAGNLTAGQLAGELKFTPAHSGVTSGPPLYDGFLNVYDGILQFEGNDWFACELDAFNSGWSIWAISRVEGSNAGQGCIAFQWKIIQVDDTTPTAWQYV